MLRGVDAREAALLGLRIVHEVGAHHGFPAVRVGMHTGAAVERNGDWFGATVNLAARVAGAAAGGEVLLTEATRQMAADVSGIVFVRDGERRFRNVSEPVLVHRAVLKDADELAGLPVDPVCRMAIDPEHGAGMLRHEDRVHHFCSLECARRFAADPDAFIEGLVG